VREVDGGGTSEELPAPLVSFTDRPACWMRSSENRPASPRVASPKWMTSSSSIGVKISDSAVMLNGLLSLSPSPPPLAPPSRPAKLGSDGASVLTGEMRPKS
jgi:hypothetical protein